MKNKNGFTLVELLAVITLLAVIGLIGFASMQKIRENINQNVFKTTLDDVLNSAETYGSDNVEELYSSEKTFTKNEKERQYITLTVAELIKYKYLDTNDIVLKTDLPEEYRKDELCVKPSLDLDCEELGLEGEACKTKIAEEEDKYCRSVNNADGNSINTLTVVVYFANKSGRVATCVPDSSFNPLFGSNPKILGDTDKSLYGDANIYCAIGTGEEAGGGSSSASYKAEMVVMDPDRWDHEKNLKVNITPVLVTPQKYAIVEGTSCSGIAEDAWLDTAPIIGTDYHYTVDHNGNYTLCTKWTDPSDESNAMSYYSTVEVTKIDNEIECTVQGQPAANSWNYERTLTVDCPGETEALIITCPTGASCYSGSNSIFFDASTAGEGLIKTVSFSVSDQAGNSQDLNNINVYLDTQAPVYTGTDSFYQTDEDKIDSMVDLSFLFSDLIKFIKKITFGLLDFSPYASPSCKELDYHGKKILACKTKVCVDGFTNATGGFNFGTDVFKTPNDNGGSGFTEIVSYSQWYNEEQVLLSKPYCDSSDKHCYWNIGYKARDAAGNEDLIGVLYVYVEFVKRAAITCDGSYEKKDLLDSYNVGKW